MKIELEHVYYMPKELKPCVLYVSKEFKTAAHLCACGCGEKVRTPLTPTEWTLKETINGPTLHPSVGNWQLACKSHYWIDQGKVIWSGTWTPEQIAMGRRIEEKRRRLYYGSRDRQHYGTIQRLWHWIKSLFN